MKIPISFTLGGQDIRVVEMNRCEGDTLGNCCVGEGKIEIAHAFNGKQQPDSIKLNTFYHELTHAILITMGQHELSDDEINWYIDNEDNIYDCAGYSLETCASLFVSKIEGDYKAIIGLPICQIFEKLKILGYTIRNFETVK